VANFGLYSNSGDEIDIEFNGRNPNEVELNYWAKGVNSHGKIAQLDFDASADFHTYAFLWKPDSLTWYADGKIIWQTVYQETGQPLTEPMPMLMNYWAGTEKLNGWIGYLSPDDYATYGEVKTAFDWISFTPVHKL
jgi:beta-glucanase (GH16 family)